MHSICIHPVILSSNGNILAEFGRSFNPVKLKLRITHSDEKPAVEPRAESLFARKATECVGISKSDGVCWYLGALGAFAADCVCE